MTIDRDKLATALDTIESEFHNLDDAQTAQAAAVTLLNDRISQLGLKIGDDMDSLETDFGQLGSTIAALAARLAKLEALAPQPVALKLGAPYYCSPDTSTVKRWQTLLAKGPGAVGLAVFNPSTGVGSSISNAYVQVLAQIKAAGIVSGVYVPSGYLDLYGYSGTTLKPSPDGVKRDPANVQNILDEITRALTWYPADWLFLDEMNTKTDDPVVFATMAKIRDHARSLGAKVCWNPGTGFLESAMPLGDLFMRFEGGTLAKYMAFVPPAWHAKYPGKMWDCVYNVPAADMPALVARAKQNKAALLWCTDDADSNVYNSPPTYLDPLCEALK